MAPLIRHDKRPWLPCAGVALLALVAAGPSLTGDFLTGDDHRLLLNHVLINHPSWTNAAKLLTLEAQRDLYQPIPLLTFAAEFSIVRWLNIPLTADGRGPATILFHSTNILLHVINAVLVFALIRRLSDRNIVAFLTAALFACHPLSVESYAWLNGRMTLLSVMFSLLALLAFDRLIDRFHWKYVATAVVAIALAMMSKVRAELPLLLLALPLARSIRPPRSWWWSWVGATILTGAFIALNFFTTAEEGMFEGAARLEGSRLARTVIALGWYFWSYVWPVNLSPHYPTDDWVDWSHVLIPISILRIVVAFVVVGLSLRRTRVGWLGLLWFLASVGPTLPLIPARNLMAADRYVYFANVGLCWMTAAFVVFIWRRYLHTNRLRATAVSAGCLIMVAAVVVSWRTASSYRNDLLRARREAEVFPNEPGVWERVGWAHYDRGEYVDAIAAAQIDLQRHPEQEEARVLQLMGMAKDKLGQTREAIADLRRAAELMPDQSKPHARLARVLEANGHTEEAIEHYRRAVEIAPEFNPAVLSLADLLRAKGETGEAQSLYEQALKANPYDVNATLALAEMDIAASHYAGAEARLRELLSWMPGNSVARTNLGVCLVQSGRPAEGAEQYREALASDPANPIAATNLAGLYSQRGQHAEAQQLLNRSLHWSPTDLTLLLAYQDACAASGQERAAIAAWAEAVRRVPESAVHAAWLGWSQAVAELWMEAEAMVASLRPLSEAPFPAPMAEALIQLHHGRPKSALTWVAEMSEPDRGDEAAQWSRFFEAVGAYGSRHPREPWPYYVIAAMMLEQGDARGHAALDLFEQLCSDDECRQWATELRARFSRDDGS